MNYSIHPQIREALKRAESVNVRGEVSIPLYRLKEELEKRRIERQDFKDYLFRYIPQSDKTYIEEILPLLFPNTASIVIDKKETFRITSGLC